MAASSKKEEASWRPLPPHTDAGGGTDHAKADAPVPSFVRRLVAAAALWRVHLNYLNTRLEYGAHTHV